MHNIKDIRLNSENFINLLKGRNSDIDIYELLLLDKSNRDLIKKKELLEQEKKKISKTKDQSLFKKSINLSKQIDELEIKNNEFKTKIDALLSNLPNLPLKDVPVGKDETYNKIIYQKGIVPKFEFKPKSHEELGKNLNMIDFDLATKTSGSRFVFLKNSIARLERALSSFMLDTHTAKNGYSEMSPP